MNKSQEITGGCQCGAVRFEIAEFGRSSICHCRMCQKAFGSYFGALVSAKGIKWTRGKRSVFKSSNHNQRGFCKDCGTPLTYEYDGKIDVAICALDNPSLAEPTVQINTKYKQSIFDSLAKLPSLQDEEIAKFDAHNETVKSNQHPDQPTENWSPEKAKLNE